MAQSGIIVMSTTSPAAITAFILSMMVLPSWNWKSTVAPSWPLTKS
ncbi:hypothetical protein [Thermobifida cellulosilytica]|nr:hypothetical protein [Thermobifida cellulosilytica]